jgi:hypothetical protein
MPGIHWRRIGGDALVENFAFDRLKFGLQANGKWN